MHIPNFRPVSHQAVKQGFFLALKIVRKICELFRMAVWIWNMHIPETE